MIFYPKTELELYDICEKAHTIKVILHDKTVIEGTVYGFTSAVNNEPEIAEIDIELENGHLTGAFQDEIESIEVLEG
ncbi:hypothetical protein [Treponema sp.]|uniref:hypothetical protein n=1 Tax=Treponema sp. TaxID=166 RepID=UPI003FA1B8F6